jgi:hypothetical protein
MVDLLAGPDTHPSSARQQHGPAMLLNKFNGTVFAVLFVFVYMYGVTALLVVRTAAC